MRYLFIMILALAFFVGMAEDKREGVKVIKTETAETVTAQEKQGDIIFSNKGKEEETRICAVRIERISEPGSKNEPTQKRARDGLKNGEKEELILAGLKHGEKREGIEGQRRIKKISQEGYSESVIYNLNQNT